MPALRRRTWFHRRVRRHRWRRIGRNAGAFSCRRRVVFPRLMTPTVLGFSFTGGVSMSERTGLKFVGGFLAAIVTIFVFYLVREGIALVSQVAKDWTAAEGVYTTVYNACRVLGWLVLACWSYRTLNTALTLYSDDRKSVRPAPVSKPSQQNGHHQHNQQQGQHHY